MIDSCLRFGALKSFSNVSSSASAQILLFALKQLNVAGLIHGLERYLAILAKVYMQRLFDSSERCFRSRISLSSLSPSYHCRASDMAPDVLRTLRLPAHRSSFAPGGSSRWTNRDLDPVPRHQRKWRPYHFVSYWLSDALGLAQWQVANGIIAVGLGWKDVLVIIAVSYFILAVSATTRLVLGFGKPALLRQSIRRG